jgi:hypothetical protein
LCFLVPIIQAAEAFALKIPLPPSLIPIECERDVCRHRAKRQATHRKAAILGSALSSGTALLLMRWMRFAFSDTAVLRLLVL